jgi:hypothetical protein
MGAFMDRRGFLGAFGGLLVAAPAIVRAASLMDLRGSPLVIAQSIEPVVMQEFPVWSWDDGVAVKKIIRLSQEEVMRGDWQKYYGPNALFAVEGEQLAKHKNDWSVEGKKYLSEHRSLWDEPPLRYTS